MPRGKLFFVPGIVWHITHRCHDRSYLLKFHKDKKRWLHWLYKARLTYGLQILNYALTSNHIHLLVLGDDRRSVIARSMQLVAGRTAWEYNRRKDRSGAFWEGPYFGTAVQDDHHLIECMVYIDLNMVRAGVVDHPRDWPYCGYNEMMGKRRRTRLIDKEALLGTIGQRDWDQMREFYGQIITDALASGRMTRDRRWTENIAVGSDAFIKNVKQRLGYDANDESSGRNARNWLMREDIV